MTVLNADGSANETVTVRSGNGNLLSRIVTTTSASKDTITIDEDINGDGLTDYRTTTTHTANGDATTIVSELGTNGAIRSSKRTEISSDGLSKTEKLDNDGNGVYEEQTQSRITINADGSRTEAISKLDVKGNVIAKTVTTTSANGLIVSTGWYNDGKTRSHSSNDVTVLKANGDTERTVSIFKAIAPSKVALLHCIVSRATRPSPRRTSMATARWTAIWKPGPMMLAAGQTYSYDIDNGRKQITTSGLWDRSKTLNQQFIQTDADDTITVYSDLSARGSAWDVLLYYSGFYGGAWHSDDEDKVKITDALLARKLYTRIETHSETSTNGDQVDTSNYYESKFDGKYDDKGTRGEKTHVVGKVVTTVSGDGLRKSVAWEGPDAAAPSGKRSDETVLKPGTVRWDPPLPVVAAHPRRRFDGRNQTHFRDGICHSAIRRHAPPDRSRQPRNHHHQRR